MDNTSLDKRLKARRTQKSKYGPNGERPSGKVLVHNHIRRYVDMPRGLNGFRYWYDFRHDPQHFKSVAPDAPPKYIICKCGWRPDLGVHYRIKGMGSANYRVDTFEMVMSWTIP
jgi:hypothetical protein